MKYVIIGNSAAAIGCVEGIRQVDQTGEIVIISNEKHHTYSRPLISYLLLGKTDIEKMKYRSDDFYSFNNCTFIFDEVTQIVADKKCVKTTKQSINYDKLLVATGSSPFIPPMSGLEKVKNKFTFSCLDDALKLQDVVGQDTKVLIIGAGLIGLKCAEGISKKTKSTLVDLSPKVLSSILDDDGSQMIKEHIEESGISFYLGKTVKEFEKNSATLDDGTKIEFDILVLALGVRPNVQLVEKAGGKVNRGVVVNEKSQTSLKDVYSAGDCTESTDVSSGDTKVMALLPNAYMQGEVAGINMAGGDAKFDKAIPMNAIGFFGKHIITAGTYGGDVFEDKKDGTYKKLFFKDNKLKGYILIGEIEKAGIYTSLIREQTPLDSVDFELICERPGLIAFSKEERQKKLGGEKN